MNKYQHTLHCSHGDVDDSDLMIIIVTRNTIRTRVLLFRLHNDEDVDELKAYNHKEAATN